MARSADDYFDALSGWQAETARALRRDILAAGGVAETLKWGQPVYEANGPVCLIKAHKGHVTLGFWRGADMVQLDNRIEPGSTSMAYVKLTETTVLPAADVARLVAAAVELNRKKGDPLARA